MALAVYSVGTGAFYFYLIAAGYSPAFSALCLPISLLGSTLGWQLAKPKKGEESTSGGIGALYLRAFSLDEETTVPIFNVKTSTFSLSNTIYFLFRVAGSIPWFKLEIQLYSAVLLCTDHAIAVGQPGRSLPRLGFPRHFFSEGEWQRSVLSLMDDSEIIILAAHHSKWVYWEMQQINAQNLHSKTIVAFLPWSKAERKLTIEAIAGGLRGFEGVSTTPADSDLDLVLAYKTRNDQLTCIYGIPGDGTSYSEAMTIALYEKNVQQAWRSH